MTKYVSVTGHDPATKQKKTLSVDPQFIIAVDKNSGKVIGTRNTPGYFWVNDTLLLLNANVHPGLVPEEAPEPPREPHFLYLG